MSFLAGLVKAYFHDKRTSVVMLPDGGFEARVRYSDRDLELASHSGEACREFMQPLVLRPKKRRRRLHWGRATMRR